MREPVCVRADVVRAVHLRQIAEHGGTVEARDPGLLESALARPRNLLAYAGEPPDLDSLVNITAAYAYGIARNHPFLDGNKRTAFVVCRTFLLLNGADLVASRNDKYQTFRRLARGDLSETELADWIRQRLEVAG